MATPEILYLTPDEVEVGSAQFNMVVTGGFFELGAKVTWNDADLLTTYTNETTLVARVTAGLLTSTGPVSVKVRNPGGELSAQAIFAINPGSSSNPPVISTTTLPSGTQSVAYSQTLAATGGVTPYVWELVSGTLPAGLSLSSGGVLSGTPTTVGTQTFSIRCTGANAEFDTKTYSLAINTPAAAPTLTSINPTSRNQNSGQFTLNLVGTGFASGAVVKWNGNALSTTFVSATALTAIVPAGNLATAATALITVTNPDSQNSNSRTFTISLPAPVLASVNPASATVGGAAFTITVQGSFFTPGALVSWNGNALTTSYTNSSFLEAQVPASFLNAAGTASIVVTNNDAQQSGAFTFTIQAAPTPPPDATSLAPNTIAAGNPAFTLTVNGTNFVNGAVVKWNNIPLTTFFVSATRLTATVSDGLVAAVGTALVSVMNPDMQSTAPLSFTVAPTNNPTPVLTSISPTNATVGGATFTLSVFGAGFVASSVVRVNGSARTTTFISANELRITVSSGEITAATTLSITVANPTPGGGVSASANLTVAAAGSTLPTLPAGLKPIKARLRIKRGNTFAQGVTLRTATSPYNLTGVIGKLQARAGDAASNTTALLDLTTENGGLVITPLLGYVLITLTDVQTAALAWDRAFYELTLRTTAGIVVTVLKGEVSVEGRVTIL